MLKKLTNSDVKVEIKEADFGKNELKEKEIHPDYFLFQSDALKQIRFALDNPKIFPHFVITGSEGIGKRSGILSLLKKEYITKNTYTKYYYFRKNNSIIEDPDYKEGLVALFDPDIETTSIVYDPTPSVMGLMGVPTEKRYQPGNLIKATGGYLVLPMFKLLNEPYLYDVLKSCLVTERLDFANLPEVSFFQSFDRALPQFPLQLRVILIGEDYLYEQLMKKDSDLRETFGIKIELDYEAELSKKNINRFSLLIDNWVMEDYPKPVPSAKKRLLEYALKLNDSQSKFSLRLTEIKKVFEESLALGKAKKEITDAEIEAGIANIDKRNSLHRKKYYEDIQNGSYNIFLTGKRVGRINGLSIIASPQNNYMPDYGQVNTISARAVIGSGNFINIEREVNLSGDIHDKGVFVLQSYIKGFFSHLNSFALDASIMFEQNQYIVDGDSASAGELLAILSALSDIEISSTVAVSGSVTQYGEILPVGAINQKIEAWFDICQIMGSARETYSVYIPVANSKDLILSEEIRESMKKDKFRILTFSHIIDLIPELMKLQIGKIEKDGKYTQNSLMRAIEDRVDRKKEIDKD
ncbi:MAG: AAA family ATPase [Leptospiraceae bacterium]|nr:AAA family ATPase [Leptospiraceae bacterium]MCK6380908.1 AAA family ATPase [Leptospiraceae bacterium]NUM40036.1 AAA family ATPase [Leptospiraceae bacterium]